MIIWAGWGILGVLLALAGALFGSGVAGITGLQPTIGMGLGMILGSVATWFVGRWFNVTRAAEQEDKLMQGRKMEIDHLVQSGNFHLGPGYPAPRSYEEARAQADQLLANERAQLAGRAGNKHTIFFIPMQYFAFVTAGIGVILAIMGMA